MSKIRLTGCITVLLAVGILLFFAARADARGGEESPADRTEDSAVAADTAEAPMHLLLLGCDRAARLTDSILLVRVAPESGDVRILQLPRDTYAAYTERDYKKLNGLYNTLGADGAAEWLGTALGVRIDHVAVYDLDCVRHAVDAVGGVEIDIPFPMSYSDPVQGLEINLPAGVTRLNGEMAEQFVRFRAGYADADLGRLDAQKRFLEGFFRSCRALPPNALVRLCLRILPDVRTDLPPGDAVRLAFALRRAEHPSFSAKTAPGEAAKGVSGAWYYILRRADMTGALSWWSGEEPVAFDPARQFDRTANPEFHRIYTASDVP